jgi:hypothetical protein
VLEREKAGRPGGWKAGKLLISDVGCQMSDVSKKESGGFSDL